MKSDDDNTQRRRRTDASSSYHFAETSGNTEIVGPVFSTVGSHLSLSLSLSPFPIRESYFMYPVTDVLVYYFLQKSIVL